MLSGFYYSEWWNIVSWNIDFFTSAISKMYQTPCWTGIRYIDRADRHIGLTSELSVAVLLANQPFILLAGCHEADKSQ